MTLKLFNTLTRKKEIFKPLIPGKVSMYVCGPTVYNYIHIGNARPIIVFDVVRRYFIYQGYDVDYVSNFTDVDDKIMVAANELGISITDVAERFIAAFFEDIDALNVQRATHYPRVTENIVGIIEFIQELMDKGYAYEAAGDVYFETRKFSAYGKLSQQPLQNLVHGIRVEQSAVKRDVADFTLWKKAKAEEISWKSPWGRGRPGWHIECSAMAQKYLDNTIDIHAGGHDLIFPHHEDEIAQSEARTGEPFANYWLHNAFLNINGEKMSKSLGNFISLRDCLKQQSADVVRFFMLSVHYRTPLTLSDESLTDAKHSLARLKTAYQNVVHYLKNSKEVIKDSESDSKWLSVLKLLKQKFELEMDDDFNTANAITVFHELAKQANIYQTEKQASVVVLREMLQLMEGFAHILGFILQPEKAPADVLADAEIEALLAERLEARKKRDFAKADAIRASLQEKKIMIEDTAQGTRYKRSE